VAESVWEAEENYLAATIAYLHDTIEDTTITRATLRAIGFPREIVDAVTMLTSGEDEEYEHYIERLLQWGSDDALTVKLADLTDNLRSLDSSTFTEPKKARLKERWLDARMRVLAEQNRRDAVRQITDWQVDKLLGEAA
jgi:(p)ppGpp synthase/HD superfamily hydrolase